jgi:hypothetical protein
MGEKPTTRKQDNKKAGAIASALVGLIVFVVQDFEHPGQVAEHPDHLRFLP